MAQAICHPNSSRRCHIPQTAHSLQHRPRKHRHRLYAQFQSAHGMTQRAAGQHATAPGHAAALIAAAQQPIAAAPKQQTGNEHLDGKLKIIGILSLFLNSSIRVSVPAGRALSLHPVFFLCWHQLQSQPEVQGTNSACSSRAVQLRIADI